MVKIKEFVEKYNSIVSEKLKEQYLKDNLHIKTYLPFITKVTLANKLAKLTVLDTETGNINIKSDMSYLFFCRIIIEQYTDLQVETKEFYEEYDLLNQSGILDKIMQMIPEKEIGEFKMLCDMKKEDLVFNMGTPKAFINQQVERVSTIFSVSLKPVLEKISEQIENMDEKQLDKIGKTIDRVVKKIKQ